jgi:hypothetical protein
MDQDELRAIEEEIAALRQRSDELAARLVELRKQADRSDEPNGSQNVTDFNDQ